MDSRFGHMAQMARKTRYSTRADPSQSIRVNEVGNEMPICLTIAVVVERNGGSFPNAKLGPSAVNVLRLGRRESSRLT